MNSKFDRLAFSPNKIGYSQYSKPPQDFLCLIDRNESNICLTGKNMNYLLKTIDNLVSRVKDLENLIYQLESQIEFIEYSTSPQS